jgi:hypothetical protein
MEDPTPIESRGHKKWHRSGANLFFRGGLYELLSTPIYIGEIRHRRPSRFKKTGLDLCVCKLNSLGASLN